MENTEQQTETTKQTRSRGRPLMSEPMPMTLRDAFALEIMKGVLANGNEVTDPLELSRYCYRLSDAMVKAMSE